MPLDIAEMIGSLFGGQPSAQAPVIIINIEQFVYSEKEEKEEKKKKKGHPGYPWSPGGGGSVTPPADTFYMEMQNALGNIMMENGTGNITQEAAP